MNKLSDRVQRIAPSATLTITARAKELRAAGKDIIGLGAGEPDFDTPEHIKKAAIQAIESGFTKYTAVDGTVELKSAIIAKFKNDNNLQYKNEQVLVSCGAKHSFFNLTQALLNSGDEVIIPAPYWVSYPDIVLLAGGTPVFVECSIEQKFKLNPDQLESAISPNTRLLVLNSPSNPTGAIYSRSELQALGEVLERNKHVIVVSDDIYEHIRYTGEAFDNILTVCPNLYERSIVLNGVSKAYAMTGWRIGYAAGPDWMIKAMKKIQSQSTSNPTSISQVAAQAALQGDQSSTQNMVKAFKERHDYVYKTLNSISGISCIPSAGAFYSFPDCREAIMGLNQFSDDIAFGEHLIEQAGIAMVPGSAFGAPFHMRISFATSMDNLKTALERFGNVFV